MPTAAARLGKTAPAESASQPYGRPSAASPPSAPNTCCADKSRPTIGSSMSSAMPTAPQPRRGGAHHQGSRRHQDREGRREADALSQGHLPHHDGEAGSRRQPPDPQDHLGPPAHSRVSMEKARSRRAFSYALTSARKSSWRYPGRGRATGAARDAGARRMEGGTREVGRPEPHDIRSEADDDGPCTLHRVGCEAHRI